MKTVPLLAVVGVCLPWAARAEPSIDVTFANTVVAGSSSPPAFSDTLTGTVPVGGMFNPRLRLGLSAALRIPIGERGDLGAQWGLWRDQAFCDTCEGGGGPGVLGDELLGSTDLTLSGGHRLDVGESALRLGVLAVLPASKDALWCNPLVGAPGITAALTVPAGGTALRASARASRPFYLHNAAPVGICSASDDRVQTLTGAVSPTPWDGGRTTGANPTFTGSVGAAWVNPHALWKDAPAAWSTRISVGLDGRRDPVDPAAQVATLTGVVDVPPPRRPLTGGVSWSIGSGWAVSEALGLDLALSDRLPAWIADPGGAFRATPARTAITLSATGHL